MDVNLLKPREGNPNVLDAHGYNFLLKEIKKRGMVQPILVDKDFIIIDGEHRWRASKQLGLKEVDVVVVDADKFEAMAALINMNQIKGEFDPTKLGLMIETLIDEKGKEELEKMLALDQKLIDDLVKDAEATQTKKKKSSVFESFTPDTSENEFKKYPVKKGELWECGTHRILCGDSSNASDVKKLFSGTDRSACLFALVHPDPGKSESHEKVIDNLFDFCNSCLIVVGKNDLSEWLSIIEDLHYHNELGIWSYVEEPSETNYLISSNTTFSPLIYAMADQVSDEYKPPLQNDTFFSSTSDAFMEQGLFEGSLPKEFVSEVLRIFSNRGEIVYDPFLGSGTTLIASQMVRRTVFGIESDPEACNLCLSRWARLTSKEPVKVE